MASKAPPPMPAGHMITAKGASAISRPAICSLCFGIRSTSSSSTTRSAGCFGKIHNKSMRHLALLLLTAIAALPAEDAWTKVREMKSGTEIRIFKRGVKQPVLAKFDEANDENLVVATKTEQVAIAKDQIDRIDYRPAKTGAKVIKETKTQVDPKLTPATVPHDPPGLSSSSSSTLSMGKPD